MQKVVTCIRVFSNAAETAHVRSLHLDYFNDDTFDWDTAYENDGEEQVYEYK